MKYFFSSTVVDSGGVKLTDQCEYSELQNNFVSITLHFLLCCKHEVDIFARPATWTFRGKTVIEVHTTDFSFLFYFSLLQTFSALKITPRNAQNRVSVSVQIEIFIAHK